MEKSYRPPKSDVRRSGNFFIALLGIIERTLRRLTGFFHFTEEEQRQAGIFLDHPYEE